MPTKLAALLRWAAPQPPPLCWGLPNFVGWGGGGK